MKLGKSFSLPENLSEIIYREPIKNLSFNNFELLNMKSEQKHLSYGEYCQKKNNNKINRKKVISYFYKHLSKL